MAVNALLAAKLAHPRSLVRIAYATGINVMPIAKNRVPTFEANAQIRESATPEFIVHRKPFRVRLRDHVSVQLEDEGAIRRR